MALSVAKVQAAENAVPQNGGAVNIVQVRITFDNSYPTGGELLTGASLGLFRVLAIVPSGTDIAGSRLVTWDDATGKLKLFTALGTEALNASDQSTIVVTALVVGV